MGIFKKPVEVEVTHKLNVEEAHAIVEDVKDDVKQTAKTWFYAVLAAGAGLILLNAAVGLAKDVASDRLTSDQ